MNSHLLLIAIGNPLRGDDGVAWRVADLLGGECDCERLLQLTPELAARLDGYQTVVVVDASAEDAEVRLEPISSNMPRPSPFGHEIGVAQFFEVARRIFGFSGSAWLCRVPAYDFAFRQSISTAAAHSVKEAADRLERLLAFEHRSAPALAAGYRWGQGNAGGSRCPEPPSQKS